MSECACKGGGMCLPRGRLVTEREYQWCSGNCPVDNPCDPAKRQAYLTLLDRDHQAVPRPKPQLTGAEKLKYCTHCGRAVRDAGGKVRERMCAVG